MYTFLGLLNECESRVGEAITASDAAQATGISGQLVKFLNRAYHQIEIMQKWWWLEDIARIRVSPIIETGTAATTAGSKVVTGTDTTFVTDGVDAGDLFKFDNKNLYYEVAEVDSETSLKLTTPAIDTVATSAYDIIRNKYSLPQNLIRIKTVTDVKHDRRLELRPWHDFQMLRSGRRSIASVGDPVFASAFGKASDKSRHLYIYPTPRLATDLEIHYLAGVKELELDTDEPLIPERYQEILIDGAITMYYEHIADDVRFNVTAQDFERWMRDMLKEQDQYDVGDFQFAFEPEYKRSALRAVLFDHTSDARRHVLDNWEG